MEDLIDLLAYEEGRAVLRRLCAVLDGAHYRIRKMRSSAASYGEWLAVELTEHCAALGDVIAKDMAEIEDPDWWRSYGNPDDHHLAFQIAQAARQSLRLVPRPVESACEQVYGDEA